MPLADGCDVACECTARVSAPVGKRLNESGINPRAMLSATGQRLSVLSANPCYVPGSVLGVVPEFRSGSNCHAQGVLVEPWVMSTSLIVAAEALENELQRCEQLATELERERLDSEKNLRRAAQALSSIGESSVRMGNQLTALLAAIDVARQRQEALSASIQASAQRIRQRGEVLRLLLERWATLGTHAAEVNQLAQRPPQKEGEPNGGSSAVEEVEGRLSRLADEAESFATTAATEQFADLARQGEALRARILSARNKLRLARRTPS